MLHAPILSLSLLLSGNTNPLNTRLPDVVVVPESFDSNYEENAILETIVCKDGMVYEIRTSLFGLVWSVWLFDEEGGTRVSPYHSNILSSPNMQESGNNIADILRTSEYFSANNLCTHKNLMSKWSRR